MYQFHNGYQSGKWAIGKLRHLNLCQHTIRHMAKIYCYGVGATCAPAVQDVFRCAFESYRFPTHPPSPLPPPPSLSVNIYLNPLDEQIKMSFTIL